MPGVTTGFRSVETLDEALAVLGEIGDRARVLAGGTDVMVQYQRGEISPEVLVHIERLGELRRVVGNGTSTVGALVTHRRVAAGALGGGFPALAEAAATVGGWQTQEVGTLGGNICNASPAADTVPPLLIANAEVHLASVSGTREVPLEQFLVGRRQTSRRPDELVTHVGLEPVAIGSGETYLKVAPRRGMEVALVGLATRVTLAADRETVADARVAVCSVAPVPFRARAAEEALMGSKLEEGTLREAGGLLVEATSPIDDPRATSGYRRRVLAPLLARALDISRRRAQEGWR